MSIVELGIATVIECLRKKDRVTFTSQTPKLIDGKTFDIVKIQSVWLCDKWNHIFELKNQQLHLFMTMDSINGTLTISRMVSFLFALDIVYRSMEPKGEMSEWTDQYHIETKKIDCILYDEDCRDMTNKEPDALNIGGMVGKKFTYECFFGKSGSRLIDIETFDGNIVAYLTVILPAHRAIERIEGERYEQA